MKKLLLLSLFIFLSIGNVWATDYTQDITCFFALLMNIDENPLSDSSGKGNTAALKAAGEPDFTSSGKFNGGYIWDGSDDYAQITDFVGGNLQIASATSWIYFNTQTNDDYIINYGSAATNGFVFLRDDVGSGSGRTDCIKVLIDATTDYSLETATNSATSGSWIHIAFTFSATADALRIYINGVEDVNSPNTTGSGNLTNPVTNCFIGASTTTASNNMHNGTMDDVGFFIDLELSSTQINDIMDNGLNGLGSGGATTRRIMYIM